MRALVIGPAQIARVAAVRAHAQANVIPFARIHRIVHGKEAPYFTPDFLAEIPCGFRVVYAIEEQEGGAFRHLSVSVDGSDRWPHPGSVEALLAVFGMPTLAESTAVWTEPQRGEERQTEERLHAREIGLASGAGRTFPEPKFRVMVIRAVVSLLRTCGAEVVISEPEPLELDGNSVI